MTPARIAWGKYKKNGPAMFGLGYAILCILVAIWAYILVPDGTRHANFQILELAKMPPGTEVPVLLVPLQSESSAFQFSHIFTGSPAQYMPIAMQDVESLRLESDKIWYRAWSGATDYRPLTDFKIDPTTSLEAFRSKYVQNHYFLLGTDTYGRDLFSRILLGTRISMSIGVMAVLISLIIGVLMGTLAGYFGGWVDQVIMWLVSVMWSIPTLLMALAIVFVLERGFWQLFLAIGVSMWVEPARLVRGQIMSVREQAFTEAARALGYRHSRIMFRHVLPNVLSPIIVVAVANFGAAVLIESGLSFLGIGVEVPVPTWGRMIYEGYTYIVFENGKWLAFFPGLALILLVVSINLIGIGLRDALDVKLNHGK